MKYKDNKTEVKRGDLVLVVDWPVVFVGTVSTPNELSNSITVVSTQPRCKCACANQTVIPINLIEEWWIITQERS